MNLVSQGDLELLKSGLAEMGTISDKIGRKKITGYGFIVWGTGILLYAFAVNFWTFLPAMVFMALGLALISGAPSAWLVDQMIRHGIYEERNQI